MFCSEAQEKYIRTLDRELGYDTEQERDFDKMTKVEASQLISALKAEIGWNS